MQRKTKLGGASIPLILKTKSKNIMVNIISSCIIFLGLMLVSISIDNNKKK